MLSVKENARFWSMVNKTEGCWEWLGYTLRDGYGRFRYKVFGRFKTVTVHRLSYRLHKGDIPDGQCVCHSCDNRACIRPSHLWVGTQRDNVRDMAAKGRRADFSGERSNKAKLTEAKVIAIRNAVRDGVKQKHLAKEYGVNHRTISAIIRGTNWATVTK